MSKKNRSAQQEIAPLENQPLKDFSIPHPVEPEKQALIRNKKNPFSTYDIAIISVFIAIGVVLNIQSSTFPKIDFFGRVSLIYGYCTICGIILGGIRGGICAAIADLLVAVVLPESGQIWMPLITLSNFFMAFIPGMIYRLSKQKLNFTLLVSSIISFVVCTLGLSAIGETLLYSYFGSMPYYPSVTLLVNTGIPVYIAFIIRKSIQQPFWIVLNLIIANLILKSTAKVVFRMKRR